MSKYQSVSIGGSTASGPGLDRMGEVPDVRITLTNRPLGALSSNEEFLSKSSKIERSAIYKDANGFEIEFMLNGVGSSTLVDTDGDVFHKSAIDALARDSIDLNILLNHVMSVPWNIAGSVLETSVDFVKTASGEDHCILKLLTDIESKHPDAWETYSCIAGLDGRRPRKLGFSVGCLYVDAQPRQTKSGLYRGADVFEVLPVEFSIVTAPANRLAWIETLTKDMMQKGIVPITDSYRRKGISRSFAVDPLLVERIDDWMDFGPVDGPKLEKLAAYFEQKYGIIYAHRPRSN